MFTHPLAHDNPGVASFLEDLNAAYAASEEYLPTTQVKVIQNESLFEDTCVMYDLSYSFFSAIPFSCIVSMQTTERTFQEICFINTYGATVPHFKEALLANSAGHVFHEHAKSNRRKGRMGASYSLDQEIEADLYASMLIGQQALRRFLFSLYFQCQHLHFCHPKKIPWWALRDIRCRLDATG